MSGVQKATAAEMFTGKRGRIRTYVFELATAAGFPLIALAFFLNPGVTAAHSVISQRVWPFDYLWSAGYVIGGVAILFGVMLPALRLRAFGLVILGTALTMQVIAAIDTRPDIRESFNVIYAVACFFRAFLVATLFLRLKALAADDE